MRILFIIAMLMPLLAFAADTEKLSADEIGAIQMAKSAIENAKLSAENVVLRIRLNHGMKAGDAWGDDGAIVRKPAPQAEPKKPAKK